MEDRPSVTAEVASSSLVVPAIFFSDIRICHPALVAQRLHSLERFANEQPARIGALLAALSVDPSRSRTSPAFRPIVNAKGAYRGSEAPVIVNPLNASFVA